MESDNHVFVKEDIKAIMKTLASLTGNDTIWLSDSRFTRDPPSLTRSIVRTIKAQSRYNNLPILLQACKKTQDIDESAVRAALVGINVLACGYYADCEFAQNVLTKCATALNETIVAHEKAVEPQEKPEQQQEEEVKKEQESIEVEDFPPLPKTPKRGFYIVA